MKNFNTQYLMVLMMAVMVYAASLHSTDGMLEEIQQEARKLNGSLNQTELLSRVTKIERDQTDSVDTFLCLAEMALRTIHRKLLNKTDKIIRQLFQYNLKHTVSCALDTTNGKITLKVLLDQINNC